MTTPRRSLSRRGFLGISAATGAGLGLSACGLGPGQTGQLVPSAVPIPAPFTVPLPIPRTLPPARRDASTDYFEIEQREASVELLPGIRTRIHGYEGSFPGPLLETRSGRRAVVRHVNALPMPVVVHLHGGHTPAASDGYPTDLVAPGQSRDYVYPMTQRAATLWYHDHRMDHTGEAVYRGLFGMHLVRDDEDDALPLPRAEREIALAIVDRSFDEQSQLAYPVASHGSHHGGVNDAYVEGVLGDVLLVNGAPAAGTRPPTADGCPRPGRRRQRPARRPGRARTFRGRGG